MVSDKEIKEAGKLGKKTMFEKRRLAVFEAHIELGYSEMMISKMMNLSIGTVRQDVEWCHDQIRSTYFKLAWELLDKQFARLETQRVRLLSALMDSTDNQEKIALEKLLASLDLDVASLILKFHNYDRLSYIRVAKSFNECVASDKDDKFPRFIVKPEFDRLTTETRKKIDELIKNDRYNFKIF